MAFFTPKRAALPVQLGAAHAASSSSSQPPPTILPFTPPTAAQFPTAASNTMESGPHLECSGHERRPVHAEDFESVDLDADLNTDLVGIARRNVEGTPPPFLRLQDLRNAVNHLPTAINVALSGDELARFSGDPVAEACLFNNPWEMVTETLDSLFAADARLIDVVALVCRGANGMDGLCNWLDRCINELDIASDLLEGTIQVSRMLQAISFM